MANWEGGGRCTDSRQLGRNGTAWFQRTASDDKDVRDFLCRDVSDFVYNGNGGELRCLEHWLPQQRRRESDLQFLPATRHLNWEEQDWVSRICRMRGTSPRIGEMRGKVPRICQMRALCWLFSFPHIISVNSHFTNAKTLMLEPN